MHTWTFAFARLSESPVCIKDLFTLNHWNCCFKFSSVYRAMFICDLQQSTQVVKLANVNMNCSNRRLADPGHETTEYWRCVYIISSSFKCSSAHGTTLATGSTVSLTSTRVSSNINDMCEVIKFMDGSSVVFMPRARLAGVLTLHCINAVNELQCLSSRMQH